MALKMDSDLGRFKDIVRGKVKSNLKKFVSSGSITGAVAGKPIKIPLSSIDLPRFAFGSRDQGGYGAGDGDIGDPMGGPGKKPGQGKAGDDTADHEFGVEFDPEELAQIMMEELELPYLQNKGKGGTNAEKSKYNKISNQGTESLRHNRRTFKEALKREISIGSYNPKNPFIVPQKDDRRYKSYSTKEVPEVNAVVFYMIDCSGSMQDEQRRIAAAEVFWIDLLLKASYKEIESVFIVHDTEAKEVTKEEFFTISSGGGTRISSAYKLCAEIMEKEYPFADFNVYVHHFTDSDNTGYGDNELCATILKEKILPNCNAFNFAETKSPNGSGEFTTFLENNFKNDEITVSKIEIESDILGSIKAFFEKGK